MLPGYYSGGLCQAIEWMDMHSSNEHPRVGKVVKIEDDEFNEFHEIMMEYKKR